MNDSLASTLVLCDLDNLLLGEDGNLTQVVRDVLQLFSSRGGRLTVFSQRSPRAVRSIWAACVWLACAGVRRHHGLPLCRRQPGASVQLCPAAELLPACRIPPVWALPCRCRTAPPGCCA